MDHPTSDDWKKFCGKEGLPLTCRIRVVLKNRGIKGFLVNGKPHKIKESSRGILLNLVEHFMFEVPGAFGEFISSEDILYPRLNVVTPVDINLCDGFPVGKKASKRFADYLSRCEAESYSERDGDPFGGFEVES